MRPIYKPRFLIDSIFTATMGAGEQTILYSLALVWSYPCGWTSFFIRIWVEIQILILSEELGTKVLGSLPWTWWWIAVCSEMQTRLIRSKGSAVDWNSIPLFILSSHNADFFFSFFSRFAPRPDGAFGVKGDRADVCNFLLYGVPRLAFIPRKNWRVRWIAK